MDAFWDVEGNQNTRTKPTQARGEQTTHWRAGTQIRTLTSSLGRRFANQSIAPKVSWTLGGIFIINIEEWGYNLHECTHHWLGSIH